jgi:C1A family cysteine protease
MSAIDLRSELFPVADQGQRGTCLAFAMTSAHEQARWSDASSEDLCVETLYWAALAHMTPPATADDDGLTLDAATRALADHGQGVEAEWPYDSTRDAFTSGYAPPASALEQLRTCSCIEVPTTAEAVRCEFESGRVVMVGIDVWPAFQLADASTKTVPAPGLGELLGFGHAVLVVGCDEQGRLLVRNSWGEDWAQAGYGWIDESFVDMAGLCAAVIDHTEPLPAAA